MTESDAGQILRRHVVAFNARDVDELMAGFTEDPVWSTGSDTVHGRDALRDLFSAAMSELLPTLTIQDLVADADRVAAQMVETLRVDGTERTYAIAGFYELQDGRIRSATIYREGSADVS
ncbi:hypothetical protein EV383_2195 [Pseudonocardia sediminis]|uniref:SnoaL-like domain-containing protein n=1 Tax=Pseudonocardia sediminis TaxID=1397368 RepID=A0A4V2FQQ4_PSEST|nr:nuclear transport factor 2 family protein [Pseudonocardia sediminis]RZT85330.1 hypothetical protein EV383_2195 [Pseudonocardia sediminis]